MSESPYIIEQYRDTAVRLIKKEHAITGVPEMEISADFPCAMVEDPRFHYETGGEYVVYIRHLILKDACLVSFQVEKKAEIKAVLCEGKYIPFYEQDGYYFFEIEISGLKGPTRTLYAHSIIREDGLTLRVEENDKGRCAGKYSEEDYPEIQIEAASHYTFAMRELLKQMGVPAYLHENQLGYMLLLGFETCNEVHTDYPPHWHMIFRWPNFCGSQAPHIYLDQDGKMTENIMYVDGISGVCRKYGPEEWCRFVDMYGRDLMAFRITRDGGMEVTKPGGAFYRMDSYQRETGVLVWKDEKLVGRLQMKNDTVVGKMEILWKEKQYEIQYDPLTGTVKSRLERSVENKEK